ncbi:NADPH-dependent FMN reductase [Xenorhabdus miraniensis]|uniref:Reductase n=1 Tax=Xenorhabdus miraniensis TaxID=351674 RepID=A0A2D0JNE9_9GAMM|nr:NAD(P)H-dependent oxidoreductase [Xenorhabdus miraniensis]PHM47860.1 reductase [Xenorhabdus miraniensis]
MKLGIISGSHRSHSNSGQVGDFFDSFEITRKTFKQIEHFHLGNLDIPIWDESIWNEAKDPKWHEWNLISQSLMSIDAFIIVVPEWGGMVPPKLKNLLLLCSDNELAHKPALLVSISSGNGGAFCISELRSSGYKNNKICFIPEHLILRNIEKDGNINIPSQLSDRMEYCINVLHGYAYYLKAFRTESPINLYGFQYGMS